MHTTSFWRRLALRGRPLFFAAAVVTPSWAQAQAISSANVPPLDVEACVSLALSQSPKVAEAEAKVRGFEARLAEVESVYYPKLQALAFLAPAYTVRGSGFEEQRETRWRSLRDWGPYTHLEMRLAQPLYTFGRAEAGREAARSRAKVEQARLREAQHAIALEVRRLYFLRLYPLSLLKALRRGEQFLHVAQAEAKALHENGNGEVTQVDLARLEAGRSELAKARIQAEHATDLALSALKHTMGLPDVALLEQADATLPRPDLSPGPPLPELLQKAAEQRPEWDQVRHGRKAALKWQQAERLAVWPTLALAGVIGAAWTPTRSIDTNPWHYDMYNRLTGGIALALNFDTDVALARAKARVAQAAGDELAAVERFAATGIPLDVRRAYDNVARLSQTLEETRSAVKSTRRWMTFAGNAMHSGAGEARDLLEGLAAHLQAQRSHLETVQQFYVGQAELTYAVGQLRS